MAGLVRSCYVSVWRKYDVVISFALLTAYTSVVVVIMYSPFRDLLQGVTQRGRVMHLCGSKLAIIYSNNDLSPGRRQTIIWTSARIFVIGLLETNFSEIFIEI